MIYWKPFIIYLSTVPLRFYAAITSSTRLVKHIILNRSLISVQLLGPGIENTRKILCPYLKIVYITNVIHILRTLFMLYTVCA